ncbi:hypothetical protein [Mycobacterium kansasii]|uniref:hypothetical protein n=1 Tax=Mycobacterium kansasii TaxID=1768 RepID=UPI0015E25197|nr:hypothetical protein [Mycobacterium kansasii]
MSKAVPQAVNHLSAGTVVNDLGLATALPPVKRPAHRTAQASVMTSAHTSQEDTSRARRWRDAIIRWRLTKRCKSCRIPGPKSRV